MSPDVATDRVLTQTFGTKRFHVSMAEDWEDWENEDFTPQLPAVAAPQAPAAADDVEASKFAGEDEEEDKPEYNVPKPQQVTKFAIRHHNSEYLAAVKLDLTTSDCAV